MVMALVSDLTIKTRNRKTMRQLRMLRDFFRLWRLWGDAKEAWQDAKMFNAPRDPKRLDDPHIQEMLKEFDKAIDDHITQQRNR